ncbi:hypothetical protein GR160_13205 [Flavobacterium sp. Sd200]|uniref:hypothetical protein n=1 Tax=Flavobacterium sp. Sd200 TaxID=2692211 RepID=UPI00136BB1D7|nr:hypothetical protein [Flavobacterium sp. Sd200]MXN92183.1 hypothetical protein [Flavobacterium sp. Sd200]
MKKVVMAVMLLAGVAGFAQDKPAKAEGNKPKTEKKGQKHGLTADEHAKKLAQDLALNDAQQAKVKEIFAEQEKKRAADPELKKMEKGEQHDHAAMEAKMKKDEAALDTKMKNILNAEQYAKWKELSKKGAPKHDGKKPEAAKKS